METLKTEDLLNRALSEYDAVLEELNRPEEDLVMIAACELVKNSIADFLEAFLVSKGVLMDFESTDVLSLRDMAAEFDSGFNSLNLDSIACLGEGANFAHTSELQHTRLSHYVETLKQARDLVVTSI